MVTSLFQSILQLCLTPTGTSSKNPGVKRNKSVLSHTYNFRETTQMYKGVLNVAKQFLGAPELMEEGDGNRRSGGSWTRNCKRRNRAVGNVTRTVKFILTSKWDVVNVEDVEYMQ